MNAVLFTTQRKAGVNTKLESKSYASIAPNMRTRDQNPDPWREWELCLFRSVNVSSWYSHSAINIHTTYFVIILLSTCFRQNVDVVVVIKLFSTASTVTTMLYIMLLHSIYLYFSLSYPYACLPYYSLYCSFLSLLLFLPDNSITHQYCNILILLLRIPSSSQTSPKIFSVLITNIYIVICSAHSMRRKPSTTNSNGNLVEISFYGNVWCTSTWSSSLIYTLRVVMCTAFVNCRSISHEIGLMYIIHSLVRCMLWKVTAAAVVEMKATTVYIVRYGAMKERIMGDNWQCHVICC